MQELPIGERKRRANDLNLVIIIYSLAVCVLKISTYDHFLASPRGSNRCTVLLATVGLRVVLYT